jgi:hypothetical protein
MKVIYDIIIIGSGTSALYTALKITSKYSNKKLLIIEKNKKRLLGGRAGNDIFHNTQIVTGAGVGRRSKDKLLIEWLNELGIKYKEYKSNVSYAKTFQKVDILKIIEELKKYKDIQGTFKDFFIRKLGKELYKEFRISAGYTDYENEDAYDTIYNYGMDDNVGGWTGVSIPWKKLVETAYNKIGKDKFKFNTEVLEIKKNLLNNELFQISTNKGFFYSKKIIIATNIASVRKLLPNKIYKQIHGQPFLRIYCKFDKKSSIIMKKYVNSYTVVPNILQKIIPIRPNKGIYMIAYSDNKNALKLHNYLINNKDVKEILCKLVEKGLGINEDLTILDIKYFFWPLGTHYYQPLNDYKTRKEFIKIAQHPDPNILVIGELISQKQGWTEGALESTRVVTEKWLTK